VVGSREVAIEEMNDLASACEHMWAHANVRASEFERVRACFGARVATRRGTRAEFGHVGDGGDTDSPRGGGSGTRGQDERRRQYLSARDYRTHMLSRSLASMLARSYDHPDSGTMTGSRITSCRIRNSRNARRVDNSNKVMATRNGQCNSIERCIWK
jgi:hypothetical protein